MLSPVSLPDWFTHIGTDFTVTSDSPIDVAASISVSLYVDIAGQTASGVFTAELVCDTDTFCDPSYRTPNNLNSVDCSGSGNGPKTYTGGFTGSTGANAALDGWFVDMGFYRLIKVVMYHDSSVTSGFEVFFEPFPSNKFTNWP